MSVIIKNCFWTVSDNSVSTEFQGSRKEMNDENDQEWYHDSEWLMGDF